MRLDAKPRQATVLLLLSLFLVAGGRGGVGAAPESGIAWTTIPDPLQGCAVEGAEGAALTHGAYRVVDELGAPVAGARVWGVGCGSHGEQGVLDPKDALTSDARGWVRVPEPATWGELVATASGFAAYNDGPPPPEGDDIVLVRGQHLVVELRDALDGPLAESRVGYRVYCGHTADPLQARTDADGRAVLPHARLEQQQTAWLWPFAATGAGEDIEVRDWGGTPVVLRLAPSRVVEGAVVDSEGKPVGGALVGGRTWNRGPWTTTDAAGRFRLGGVDPDTELQVDANDDAFATPQSVSTVVPPEGTLLHVRLGRADAQAPPGRRRVVVRLLDATGSAVPSARVAAWSPTHGWGYRSITGWHAVKPGDPFVLYLPDGAYDVEADGWLSGMTTVRTRIDVSADATLELRVAALPLWRVDARAVRPGDGVLLATAMRRRDVTDEVRAGSLRAPVGEPAVLRVWEGDEVWGRSEVVRLPSAPPGPDALPLALASPRPVRVRVRTVDAEGKPVPSTLAWSETWDDDGVPAPKGEAQLDVPTPRLANTLLVRPTDARLAGRRVRIDVSASSGGDVEWPPIVLPTRERSRCTVELPSRARIEERRLETVRRGREREPLWDDDLERAESGEEAPEPGTLLRATLHGHAPILRALEGSGPWHVRWPTGSIGVDATAVAGPLPQFAVLIDGQLVAGQDGRARLAGLAAGTHEVVVCASGHGARRAEITLAEGQALHLRVMLNPLRR